MLDSGSEWAPIQAPSLSRTRLGLDKGSAWLGLGSARRARFRTEKHQACSSSTCIILAMKVSSCDRSDKSKLQFRVDRKIFIVPSQLPKVFERKPREATFRRDNGRVGCCDTHPGDSGSNLGAG